MSKIYEAVQDAEIERIEGEEQFMNEPKSVAETNKGIDWSTNMYEEVSDRNEGALIHLDRNINPNPLD